MNKFLLLTFSALLFCAVAEGLMCKVCKYKLGSLCLLSGAPCLAAEGQWCEKTKVYKGDMLMYSKYNCGKHVELCNKTEQMDNVFRTTYLRTCCNSHLCNG